MRNRTILQQNLYFNRQFESVLVEADEMLELDPDTPYAWYWKGLAHAWLGDSSEALAAARRAVELGGDAPYVTSGLAFTHAVIGDAGQARDMLENAEQEGWPLVEIGLVYAWLPDLDRAFEYIDRAVQERPTALMYLNTDPGADPMRGDPRWAELQRRLAQPIDR